MPKFALECPLFEILLYLVLVDVREASFSLRAASSSNNLSLVLVEVRLDSSSCSLRASKSRVRVAVFPSSIRDSTIARRSLVLVEVVGLEVKVT